MLSSCVCVERMFIVKRSLAPRKELLTFSYFYFPTANNKTQRCDMKLFSCKNSPHLIAHTPALPFSTHTGRRMKRVKRSLTRVSKSYESKWNTSLFSSNMAVNGSMPIKLHIKICGNFLLLPPHIAHTASQTSLVSSSLSATAWSQISLLLAYHTLVLVRL